MDETGTCSICGGTYINYGNNADPWKGRACHDCDNRFVTPARMFHTTDPWILKLLAKFARQGRFLVTATARARTMYPVK